MDFGFKDVLAAIQTVGFPICVACWFLFRTEKYLDKLADHVNRLAEIEAGEIELLRSIMAKLNLPTNGAIKGDRIHENT